MRFPAGTFVRKIGICTYRKVGTGASAYSWWPADMADLLNKTEVSAAFAYLQHRQKCLLGDVDASNTFHSLLTFFLLFEEFSLAADVAPIALGDNVLADGGHSLARNDLCADRS